MTDNQANTRGSSWGSLSVQWDFEGKRVLCQESGAISSVEFTNMPGTILGMSGIFPFVFTSLWGWYLLLCYPVYRWVNWGEPEVIKQIARVQVQKAYGAKRTLALELEKPRFKSWFYYLWSLWLWECENFWSLNFPINKMGLITPLSQSCDAWRDYCPPRTVPGS